MFSPFSSLKYEEGRRTHFLFLSYPEEYTLVFSVFLCYLNMTTFSNVKVHMEKGGPNGGSIKLQIVQFYNKPIETTPSYLYQVHSTPCISYLGPLILTIFSKIRVPIVKRGSQWGVKWTPNCPIVHLHTRNDPIILISSPFDVIHIVFTPIE